MPEPNYDELLFMMPDWNPVNDIRSSSRRYDYPRGGGTRRHAGIDLYCDNATRIYAIADGTIDCIGGMLGGHNDLDYVGIDHGPDVGLIRYCEFEYEAGVAVGRDVTKGQLLGRVIKLWPGARSKMLHVERYSNTVRGALTNRSNPPYKRRADLMNPTVFIERLWAAQQARGHLRDYEGRT